MVGRNSCAGAIKASKNKRNVMVASLTLKVKPLSLNSRLNMGGIRSRGRIVSSGASKVYKVFVRDYLIWFNPCSIQHFRWSLFANATKSRRNLQPGQKWAEQACPP